MTPTARALLIYLGIALVIFVWMFRLDTKPSASVAGSAIITDRWLGTVQVCGYTSCYPIYPPKNPH